MKPHPSMISPSKLGPQDFALRVPSAMAHTRLTGALWSRVAVVVGSQAVRWGGERILGIRSLPRCPSPHARPGGEAASGLH